MRLKEMKLESIEIAVAILVQPFLRCWYHPLSVKLHHVDVAKLHHVDVAGIQISSRESHNFPRSWRAVAVSTAKVVAHHG